MIWRYLISLIIHTIFNYCNVDAYCSPPTTEMITTVDPNANFNRVFTYQRNVVTTTMEFIPTTTIEYDTCIINLGLTNSYGYRFYFNSQSYPSFDSIKISDLTSIVIYSGNNVNGLDFNFVNGATEKYGNQVGNVNLIELKNKDVIAVNIRSFEWINSIQFLIYDQIDGTMTWTSAFGGRGGYLSEINAKKFDRSPSNFKITAISGSGTAAVINILQFEYSFEKCNPQKSMPPIPPTPPLSPIITTTTILTTTSELITTTIKVGECNTRNGRSSLFGTDGSLYFLTKFDVKISDLKSIEIHSGEFVYALKFNYKNGNSLYQGYTLKNHVKSISTVDLENKQIAAFHFRFGSWLNNIKFLIYDPSNKTFSWTAAFGGQGGLPTYIDAHTLAPPSSEFQITSLSGSAHPYDYIRTLRVGYSYKECNPAEPGPEIPPTPSFSPSLFISSTLPITSSINLERD